MLKHILVSPFDIFKYTSSFIQEGLYAWEGYPALISFSPHVIYESGTKYVIVIQFGMNKPR